MKIALLLSDAPGFIASFIKLGKLLELDGYEVYFVSDSNSVSKIFNDLGGSKENLFCFGNYVENLKNTSVVENSVNIGYFADYERLRVYYNASKNSIEEFFWKASYLDSFFTNIIKKQNILILISETAAGSYTQAACLVSQRENARFIGFETSRVNGFAEIYINNSSIKFKYNDEDLVNRKAKLDAYLSQQSGLEKQVPVYMEAGSLINVSNSSLIQRLKSKNRRTQLYHEIKASLKGKKNYFGYNPLQKTGVHFRYLLNRVISKFTDNFRSHKKIQLDHNKINLLFPLHFHPEAATSIYSAEHFDEIDILTFLSSLLPNNYMLYIKEHPSMVGRRSKEDRKKLDILPKSHFLASVDEIIQVYKIDILITLTGTMGLEFALKGKKVITFGNVFFNCHPFVKKVNSKTECLNLITNNKDWSSNDNLVEINKAFLNNYLDRCAPVTLELSAAEDKEISKLRDVINRLTGFCN